MNPSETVEWVLGRDEKRIRCVRRQTERGIELTVTFCGLLVARSLAATMAHAAAWASSRRESWQAAGYDLIPVTA